MTTLRYGFLLLLGAAAATFIWSNYDQSVVVHFTKRLRTVEVSLSTALSSAVVAGFLLAWLQSLAGQFRLRKKLRESQRVIDKLGKDLAELRKLPLSDSIAESTQAGLSVDTAREAAPDSGES